MSNDSIFNPKNLPRKDLFIGSQGRLGVPTQHPIIPAHRDAVITPIFPQPGSAPKTRDIGSNPRSR